MTTYTKLRLKSITLDESAYEAERVKAMKFMQMYLETNATSLLVAYEMRAQANGQIAVAVANHERRTMFLARQHGFSDGATSYINDQYRDPRADAAADADTVIVLADWNRKESSN